MTVTGLEQPYFSRDAIKNAFGATILKDFLKSRKSRIMLISVSDAVNAKKQGLHPMIVLVRHVFFTGAR